MNANLVKRRFSAENLGRESVQTDARPDDQISAAARKGLLEVDQMPGPLRQCAHEFGFAIVHAFREAGISDPRMIRHLVNEVWNGGRQPHQRIGRNHARVLEKLDWLLVQTGSQVTAARLVRLLWQNSMVIVPRDPTIAMVEASIAATGDMGLVSKTEKHRGRLRAAIRAAVRQFWPHLIEPVP